MKFVIGGYYGAGNIGDELLLGLLLDWLGAASHDVVVVTLNESHTKAIHDTTAIDHRNLAGLVRQLKSADAFVLGGGGLFQDHHRFTISDLYTYPAPGISYYGQLCLLARQMGVPYVLFAMGVGPLRSEEARQVTREIFQHAAYASVRDQASATLLRQIGVDSEIEVGADPGWLMPRPSRIELSQLYPNLSGRRVLVVTPRQWPFSDGWRHALVKGLTEAKNAGWAILWLPFQSSVQGDDLKIIQDLHEQLDPQMPQVIAKCVDPKEAAQIIASADALVAMRLHALILGLNSRVPTLAMEYDEKLASVASVVHLADALRLRLTDPASRFCEGVRALIGTDITYPHKVSTAIDALKEDALSTRDALFSAVEQMPPHLRNCDWSDQEQNWAMGWFAQQLTQNEEQIAGLSADNSRLTTQLDAVHKSLGWRLLAPLRAWTRALEILREQGWTVLFRKLYRAVSCHTIYPVLKHLTQRKAKRQLQEILRAYPGRVPIFLSSIVPWNLDLFQRPHQLAMELAAHGYLYFFCVPINNQDRVLTFREVSPGCFITPHQDLVVALPNKIAHLYSTDNFDIMNWVRPHLAQGHKVLYEYVDEIHEDISGRPIPTHVWEKHQYLLRNEEVVCVATADKLYREVRAVRKLNCGLVTNGVDIAHFSVERDKRHIPAQLRNIVSRGNPIIGYFGALAKWFDYELVARISERRPDYEIVLIGPDYDGSLYAHHLNKLPNVTLLGTVDYKMLPRYACWFDIATIPFQINDITESTSPIKLFEYMALGHPIVTTDMPECRKYRSVLIGRDSNHFVEQIDRALTLRDDLSYRLLLRQEAEQNSWASKADVIVKLLDSQNKGAIHRHRSMGLN